MSNQGNQENQGEIKVQTKGYKQTEIGVIPEDWNVEKLGDIADIQRGASPRPIDSPLWFDKNSGIGWLRISDVSKSNKYLYQTVQFLSKEGIANSRFVKNNSLIMSICATVGRPIISRKDVCIHDGFVVFRNLSTEKEYLYYILEDSEKDWSKSGQTGSQMNLNTNLINTTKIPLPPTRTEQTAIATALSDMDSLIEDLEKLLVKKRNIKQGAMQELLTPKDGWEEKRLEELVLINMGQSPDSKYYNDSELGTPLIQGNADIKNRISIKRIWTAQITKRCIKGDVIMTVRAPVGFIGYATYDSCIGRGVCSFTQKNLDKMFFFYSMVFVENNWKILEQGSTFTAANSKQIQEFKLDTPKTIEEQQEIAQILSDMDTKISQLETQLSQYKMLKTGMMQELLTGKKRLI